MASPHMGGLTALMLEVNPSLNVCVLAPLTSTFDPMYTTDADGVTRQLKD